MYEKIEGGSSINIQGLECQLPPEGYVFNILTKSLEYRGVYERSPIKQEQYWQREPFPVWYKETIKRWDDYDKKKKDDDPDFYDERLEGYKKQEWDRRLNGHWIRNNGSALYLTGLYYFYLQHWNIDIGAPKFRIPDLEKTYFLQYCIEDPFCMGMCEVTKRRFGKSFFAGIFLIEYITRTKQSFAGIQSKKGEDAKKFFAKTVVNPFRRLPKFFRPEYDMSLGVNPKTEMRFQKTNVRGKKAEENVDKDELGSIVDWGSSDKVHYDGQKLHRYVADEVGKTTEVNVADRHDVIRYCLLDDEANIIGKAIYTTTVEKLESDKDGVQEAFRTLWNDSDQLNKGADGRTVSGLYRFFMSAKRTRNFDLYGYPDEELTLQAILADRETVKNNPRSLSARIRKEPLTIEEAFLADSDKCIFNAVNIKNRKDSLNQKPPVIRHVWFERDILGKVKWRDASPKEKDFHWRLTAFPDAKDQNQFTYDGGNKKPKNSNKYVMAIDGYSNSQGGKFGSKACARIGVKYSLTNKNSAKCIGKLHGRPAVKDTLHEQVMLCAEFFGAKSWYEHNSDDYESYFRQRGMSLYLGKYPLSTIEPAKRATAERHKGFPTGPFSLTKQNDMGIAYFDAYCDLIDFFDDLEDAEKYDPNDRNAFDETVSLLMLIVLMFEPDITPPPKKKSLVRLYN